MKAKLLISGNNNYIILCPDYSIIYNASLSHLNTFFLNFTNASLLNGISSERINLENTDIADFTLPNCETVAYITDNGKLVLNNSSPLSYLLANRDLVLIPNFVSVKEYAAMHNKSVQTIKKYCYHEKIKCIKKGRDWLIDPSSPLPPDGRKK